MKVKALIAQLEADLRSTVVEAVGAFAEPGFPAPRVSIYNSRRHSWLRLPPGTRALDKDPD
jgi:hypothetical protein